MQTPGELALGGPQLLPILGTQAGRLQQHLDLAVELGQRRVELGDLGKQGLDFSGTERSGQRLHDAAERVRPLLELFHLLADLGGRRRGVVGRSGQKRVERLPLGHGFSQRRVEYASGSGRFIK